MAQRKKIEKSGSKKLFTKTAKKTHKANAVTSASSLKGRGGRRL